MPDALAMGSNHNVRWARAALGFTLTLTLMGCFDSSPSASDMRKALKSIFDDADRQQREMMNWANRQVDPNFRSDTTSRPGPRIVEFERIGCTPDGENTFRCRFRMRAENLGILELAFPPNQVAEARFAKTRDGWQAMRAR